MGCTVMPEKWRRIFQCLYCSLHSFSLLPARESERLSVRSLWPLPLLVLLLWLPAGDCCLLLEVLGLEVLGCLEKVRELLASLSLACAPKLNLLVVSLLLICSESEAWKGGCLSLEELLLFLSLSTSSSLTYIKPGTSSLYKSPSSMPGLYEKMMLVSYNRSSWLLFFRNKLFFFFFGIMN